MNILAFLPAYVGHGHNAGAELTMHELLYALRKRGHSITVLLSQPIPDNNPYVIDGVKVQTYSSRKDLIRCADEFDLLISHLGCAEQAALTAEIRGMPMVHLIHNDHVSAFQAVEAKCDLAIFNSDWIAKRFDYLRAKKVTLHPPVNPRTYGGERGKSVTLINLWRNKGPELFYEMAKRFPDVPFLGIKGGYNEQIVEDLPNVTILENQEDIRVAYRQTKLLLMPSAYESYGRVGVEAAASGIPTVSSGTVGLLEALGEHATVPAPSVTVPGAEPRAWTSEDFDAWEAAIKKILTPAGYGKASKAALARSAEVWQQTEAELEEFCLAIERL
jgi:glycosyltransferase involved in cell wall biosynthesis